MYPLGAPSVVVGALVARRYRIDSVIGQGSSAVVLGATDERTDQPVAVKLLRTAGIGRAERFIREARLAWTLSSDHVPRFIDAGEEDGRLYLVLERLEGSDYSARLRAVGPLELSEVVDCIVQACEALAHAHSHRIVHRDVKASNLFLQSTPRGPIVKVLDFGISKILADTRNSDEVTLTKTEDGGVLGSPPYMSPEQVRNPRNVDARSDLWSLGVVAYRLLSGKYPFPGTTTGEVLASILETIPPRLADVGAPLPARAEAAIMRCLARERADRFANVAELAFALAPFVSPRWQGLPRHIGEILAVAPPDVVAPEASTLTITEPLPPRLPIAPDMPMAVPQPVAAQTRLAKPHIAMAVGFGVAILGFLLVTNRGAPSRATAEPGEQPTAAPSPIGAETSPPVIVEPPVGNREAQSSTPAATTVTTTATTKADPPATAEASGRLRAPESDDPRLRSKRLGKTGPSAPTKRTADPASAATTASVPSTPPSVLHPNPYGRPEPP